MPPGAVHTNKHGRGFDSRCTKRVLWIVGSTDRHLILLFHPGTNARLLRSSVGTGKRAPRVIVTHAVWAIRCQSRPKPRDRLRF